MIRAVALPLLLRALLGCEARSQSASAPEAPTGAVSDPAPSEEGDDAAEVEGPSVGRHEWVAQMKTALPTAFCQEHMFFRQCFDVTEDECISTSLRTAKTCLMEYQAQIPAVLRQPKDGTVWGQKVGSCAGTNYEISLKKKMVSDPKCKDPSHWVP